MNEKKLLIENLILSMLAIDDETAGLLIKDAPRLDEETKKRLRWPFLNIDISEYDILDVLKGLRDAKLLECVIEDGKRPFEGSFEQIPTEADNYDVWFRITESGKNRLEDTNNLIWTDK